MSANTKNSSMEQSVAEPMSPQNTMAEVQEVKPYYNEYAVTLDIDPEKRTAVGVEKIKFKNKTKEPMDKIYLHIYSNAFQKDVPIKPYFDEFANKIFKYGKDYGYTKVLSATINNADVNFNLKNATLLVNFKEPLPPEAELELTIQFESYIPKICHRTGANDSAIWFGNFIPSLSVYDEFGWHNEPYYPAGDPFYSEISNYTVKITTPTDYTVIATGSEKNMIDDNKKVTTITAKLVRDFAFAIGNQYQLSSIQSKSGVTVNFYHYSDIKNINEFLEVANKALDYYSNKIGTYPYQSLDIVETELFLAGGMEYPQFIMLDSDYIKNSRSIISLAHEVSHQWFYNIIGNNQIKEAWIDEGLAVLLQEYIFYSDHEIDAQMKKTYANLSVNLKNIEDKTLLKDLSVYTKWSDYYNVQYLRSKLMFYNLKKLMGDEKFDEFLKKYYAEYSFKVVNKDSLVKTCEEIYGGSLDTFFDSWFNDFELPPMR